MNYNYFFSRFSNKLRSFFNELRLELEAIPNADLEKYKGLIVEEVVAEGVRAKLEEGKLVQHVSHVEAHCIDIATLIFKSVKAEQDDAGLFHLNHDVLSKLDNYDFLNVNFEEMISPGLVSYVHFEHSDLLLKDGKTIVDGAFLELCELTKGLSVTFVTKQKHVDYSLLDDPAEILATAKCFTFSFFANEPVRAQINELMEDPDFTHSMEDGWFDVIEKCVNWAIAAQVISSDINGFINDYSDGFPSSLREVIDFCESYWHEIPRDKERWDEAQVKAARALEEADDQGHYRIFRIVDVAKSYDAYLK